MVDPRILDPDNIAVLQEVHFLRSQANSAAGSFWFFLIVAGIVWFFASWLWALIPLAFSLWIARHSWRCSTEANKNSGKTQGHSGTLCGYILTG